MADDIRRFGCPQRPGQKLWTALDWQGVVTWGDMMVILYTADFSQVEFALLNYHLGRRPIQILFSVFSVVFYPTWVKFSVSQNFLFSPNGFDVGRVDCISDFFFFYPRKYDYKFQHCWFLCVSSGANSGWDSRQTGADHPDQEEPIMAKRTGIDEAWNHLQDRVTVFLMI